MKATQRPKSDRQAAEGEERAEGGKMPSVAKIQAVLSQAKSVDDFFGKEGLLAQLFARTIEEMLEGELSEELGYEKYEAKGRGSGNSRNGKRRRRLRTSGGEVEIEVPRDRKGVYQPQVLDKYQTKTNELEGKIIALYAKGLSTRDIEALLKETYGVNVSAGLISAITDKVWPLVEGWQNRSLATIYPIIYLDAMYVKLRRDSKVEKVAVYSVLAVDVEGRRDVLGHWLGDGAEGANFWLSVLTDLTSRGVEDVFIACVDGLSGFASAIEAVFPHALVQRCIIHQIRHALKYVVYKDRQAFIADLKKIYQAPTRELAETHLLELGQTWNAKYAIAVRSWQTHWDSLATFFDFPPPIRRLIYTTNAIEGYHRQLRKVTKSKAAFPTDLAVRKLLYLATDAIVAKWYRPLPNWGLIRNQLAIRFEGRMPL